MKKMTKTISKKLIVSTLSTVMGVSLVGAVTGTVAWYQYSTRSTVSFVGTSLGVSEKLLVSFSQNDGYDGDIVAQNHDLYPVTSKAMEENSALPAKFKAQPIYQNFEYSKWIDADESAYVQFDVYIKYNMVDENGQPEPIDRQKAVYLTDLVIQEDAANPNGKEDISDALRVHLKTDDGNMLLSHTGEDIDVHGKLDLNGDGKLDTNKPAYSFVTDGVETDYGEGVQKTYSLDDVKPGEDFTGGIVLGTLYSKKVHLPKDSDFSVLNDPEVIYYTDADLENAATGIVDDAEGADFYVSQDVLKVTVTIWLEGWHQFFAGGEEVENLEVGVSSVDDYFLDENCTQAASGTAQDGIKYYAKKMSAIWDPAKYIGAMFDIGLMFEVEADL